MIRDDAVPDDAVLAARIAAGDEAAFVIAYDRHVGFLFGSLVRFLGDRETAAEVVQDAFVTLWRRAGLFDARSGSLLTWLLAIARHRAIDRLRAEGRRPGRDAVRLDVLAGEGGFSGSGGSGNGVPRYDSPPELVAGAATDPSDVAGRRWIQSVVRTGISELPENERQVIMLGYTLDLSQSQIADRLDWPLGTVKSRTRRAMAQLRTRLGPMLEADEATHSTQRAEARSEPPPAESAAGRDR